MARTPAQLAKKRISDKRYRDRLKTRDPDWRKWENIRDRYKLTKNQFYALLASQGNACAICGFPFSGVGDVHVDHDHSCCPTRNTCGKCVRGLLHGNCNRGLHFVENAGWLKAAQDYLA